MAASPSAATTAYVSPEHRGVGVGWADAAGADPPTAMLTMANPTINFTHDFMVCVYHPRRLRWFMASISAMGR